MIRIVFEVVVLMCIAGGILYLARQWDLRRPVAGRHDALSAHSALQAPPEARWRAVHTGTADERTEVQIVLRAGDRIWDRRTCAVIANLDPDYDRLLFNALEDARTRAELLNGLRDE
jgi:hypothetical protein